MFEFLEDIAQTMIIEVDKTITEMEGDATKFELDAKKKLEEADMKEAKASSLENASYTRAETTQTLNEDGTYTTETTWVEDVATKMAAMAEAAALRVTAQSLRNAALSLKALRNALKGKMNNLQDWKNKLNNAIVQTCNTIGVDEKLVDDAIDTINDVLKVLWVPDVKSIGEWTKGVKSNWNDLDNDKLKEGVGELFYNAINSAVEAGFYTGAVLVRAGTSIIAAELGTSPIGWVGGVLVKGLGEGVISNTLTDTNAKTATKTIAGWLGDVTGIDIKSSKEDNKTTDSKKEAEDVKVANDGKDGLGGLIYNVINVAVDAGFYTGAVLVRTGTSAITSKLGTTPIGWVGGMLVKGLGEGVISSTLTDANAKKATDTIAGWLEDVTGIDIIVSKEDNTTIDQKEEAEDVTLADDKKVEADVVDTTKKNTLGTKGTNKGDNTVPTSNVGITKEGIENLESVNEEWKKRNSAMKSKAHKDYREAHAKVNSLNDKIANNQRNIDELRQQMQDKQNELIQYSLMLSEKGRANLRDKIKDINDNIEQLEALNMSYRNEQEIYSKMETDALNIINQGKK